MIGLKPVETDTIHFKANNCLTVPRIFILNYLIFVWKHPEYFTDFMNKRSTRNGSMFRIPKHKTILYESEAC